jgi:hypothetical protein
MIRLKHREINNKCRDVTDSRTKYVVTRKCTSNETYEKTRTKEERRNNASRLQDYERTMSEE